MKEKRYISPFNRNSDDLEGSGIGSGAYPPSPKVRSFPGLIAGVLSAAAFVAVPSAASAQLQLTVLALETDRIELSISGTLVGTPSGPAPSSELANLYIQGPGDWTSSSGVGLTLSGSQPLTGVTLSSSQAVSAGSEFGDRLLLGFDSDLTIGVTQGSGGNVTLVQAQPGTSASFNPSAIAITDLRLHWGYDGEPGQPFGAFQSNAVVPEPSAYAALIGLAALGCVALRRRAL